MFPLKQLARKGLRRAKYTDIAFFYDLVLGNWRDIVFLLNYNSGFVKEQVYTYRKCIKRAVFDNAVFLPYFLVAHTSPVDLCGSIFPLISNVIIHSRWDFMTCKEMFYLALRIWNPEVVGEEMTWIYLTWGHCTKMLTNLENQLTFCAVSTLYIGCWRVSQYS